MFESTENTTAEKGDRVSETRAQSPDGLNVPLEQMEQFNQSQQAHAEESEEVNDMLGDFSIQGNVPLRSR